MVTEQKSLDPEARAKLVVVGVLIVSALVMTGLLVSTERLGLRGTLADAPAMMPKTPAAP